MAYRLHVANKKRKMHASCAQVANKKRKLHTSCEQDAQPMCNHYASCAHVAAAFFYRFLALAGDTQAALPRVAFALRLLFFSMASALRLLFFSAASALRLLRCRR